MATALGIALSFGCCRRHDRCLVAAPSGKDEDHAECTLGELVSLFDDRASTVPG